MTQLSWSNNLQILSGAKSKEERHFYLKLSIKNNYSKRELDRQISSAYYERYMLSDKKQSPTINKIVDENDYPNTKILDTYSLEFLDLPNEFSEKNLKSAIINNLKDSFRIRKYNGVIEKYNHWINSVGKLGQKHNDNDLRIFTDKEDIYLDRWDFLDE